MKNKKNMNIGALKVAGGFFVLSFFWILFSDRVLFYFFKDASQLTVFQTYKGWFYVLMATIFVFYLVNREIDKKNTLIQLINKKNEWYNHLLSNIPGIEVMLFDKNDGYIMAHGNNILLTDKILESKNIDEKLVIVNSRKTYKLKEIKDLILFGDEIKFETLVGESHLELIGQPVFDDNNSIIAGLLVILDSTRHKQILQELRVEKQNYEALFKEYHSVNLELKQSYSKLQESMILLRESKERYETFLMQTTEAVYRIDLDSPVDITLSEEEQIGQIITHSFLAECNPVFAEIYGYANHSDLYNRRLVSVENQTTIQQFKRLINEFVNNKYILRNIETKEIDSKRNIRFFLNNLIGIIDNSKLQRIWGIKTDISRLKQYESELIAAKKVAEKSDQLKSAFLANMSHEIRTPLNGILGFSELLCQENLPEESKLKYSSVVKASNTQLLRIIDDILDISRIETGQLSVSKELFHLNILFNELEVFVKQELKKRQKNLNVAILKSFPDDLDILLSDRQRVYQVLTNLLNNAVKFTERGKIEFGYLNNNSTSIEFFVSDTGIGIPNSEFETIFQQFKQVEDYTARKYGGTGLGLSISKGIVELLGGKIWVRSQIGKGSEFRFSLPLVQSLDQNESHSFQNINQLNKGELS